MRTHTNAFKQKISSFGREISSKVYKYNNYNLITEASDTLITEDNIALISEQINASDKTLIDEENIYSMSIVKNGQLLQSLMKEFDFETKEELKVGDVLNPQFGVYVNNAFEYLDYGNYIIYSKEYIAENQTWQYVCYDKMLYSMLPYKPLNLTYPCTIREYIIALADRIGLAFANASDTFINYNQQVQAELFEGQNITYRDILDKLSEITASNILINDNDELELGYINATNDSINEDNLRDVNVNFGETFGPINKIVITETDGGYEYSAQDNNSIETNGLTQINIVDNLFAFNGDSEVIASNILTELSGILYSINNFTTTGVAYYDFLDMFNVVIGANTYQCLLLNNEITISQGLEETIFTDKLENSEKESNNFKVSDVDNKTVQFQINKQKGEIQSKVEKDGVISAINQSAEEIQINANKIKLEGYTTINDGFSIDLDGNMIANNGTFNGGQIILQDSGDKTFPRFELNSTSSNSYIYSSGFAFENTSEENSVQFFGENEQDPSFEITIWGDLKTRVAQNGLWASAYNNMSLESKKKNFEKLENALDIIKQTDIYKYNLKNENDKAKKHIGLVIGDNYNYSKEITSNENDSVDLYSMISVCFKAIKEQQEQIGILQTKIEKLEKEVK